MRARWLLLPLLLALQACSGTTFGQKLADSFDSPATPAAAQGTARSKVEKEPDTAFKEPGNAEDQSVKEKEEKETEAKTKAEAKAEPESEPEAEPEAEATKPAQQQASNQDLTTVQPAQKESAPVRPLPADPRPYRITIRLAAADPAAPAESVTDALRSAGIGFEVETIEKIPSLQTSKKAASDSPGQP